MEVLRVEGLRKSYAGYDVLRGVDLEVRPGEVLGLVGANGVGKSTLASVLAGLMSADSGTMTVAGRLVDPLADEAARTAAVGIIEQRFNLDPGLRVAEAIFRHTDRRHEPYLALRHAALEVLIDAGIALDPDSRLGELSRADVGLVETARLMADPRPVVILDEVDADFNPRELEELRYVLDRLASDGRGVLYITQRPEEALAFCGRIAVLRDGVVASVVPSLRASVDDITAAMFADDLPQPVEPLTRPTITRRVAADDLVQMRIRDLRWSRDAAPVNLDLRAGEVLGVVADRSPGLREVTDLLVGESARPVGLIEVAGVARPLLDPRDAVCAGIACLPVDGEGDDLRAERAVARALVISDPPARDRFGREIEDLARCVRALEDAEGQARRVLTVLPQRSGGQQQLRRARAVLTSDARVVILCEPARGLDMRARRELQNLVNAFVARGGAVLLQSVDPGVLLAFSTRLAVWSDSAFRAAWDPRLVTREDLDQVMRGNHDLHHGSSLHTGGDPADADSFPRPVLTA